MVDLAQVSPLGFKWCKTIHSATKLVQLVSNQQFTLQETRLQFVSSQGKNKNESANPNQKKHRLGTSPTTRFASLSAPKNTRTHSAVSTPIRGVFDQRLHVIHGFVKQPTHVSAEKHAASRGGAGSRGGRVTTDMLAGPQPKTMYLVCCRF